MFSSTLVLPRRFVAAGSKFARSQVFAPALALASILLPSAHAQAPAIVVEQPANTPLAKPKGSVVSWGHNTFAQVGNTPVGLTDVRAISAGDNHTVALRYDGTVVAWGRNNADQTVVPGGLTNVKAIAAGWYHTVALQEDGTVVAWGGANGTNHGQATVPDSLTDVRAIAAGALHTVALKSDGTVVAWGYNLSGEINVPTDLVDVQAIDAGTNHTLALKTDGSIAAWGSNSYGQTDVPVDAINIQAVSAGGSHATALKADGTITAWGDTDYSQSNVPSNLSDVEAISDGRTFVLALKTDGTVVAWGSSGLGQTSIPHTLTRADAIAAGGLHGVALVRDLATSDFGTEAVGATGATRTFTIRNSGTGPLNLGAITKSGPHAGDFTVTVPADASVAADDTTTFTVAFAASAAGARKATLEIASDDPEFRSFDIALTGNGLLLPELTIDDVTKAEGNSGTTTFTFTVSLSSPALAGGVTFDIATADNTATTVGSDYIAKSLTDQTIAEGDSTYTFSILVLGERDIETDESFFVNITNVSGATVGDSQGTGTLTSDDTVDLSVNLSASTPYVDGDLIYTIEVTNHGTLPAVDSELNFVLPTGTTFVSLTTPAGWSATTPAIGSHGTIYASISSLAAGSTTTFTVTVHVPAPLEIDDALTATASVSTSSTESDSSNNEHELESTIAPLSDLGVTVVATPTIAAPLGTVTYAITITNHGRDPVYPAMLATLYGNVSDFDIEYDSTNDHEWRTFFTSETEALFGFVDSAHRLASGESAIIRIVADVAAGARGSPLALKAVVDAIAADLEPSNDEVVARLIVGPALTSSDATAINGVSTGARVIGALHAPDTSNVFSFTAHAGDRIYATTATTPNSDAPLASRDTVLSLVGSDGSTMIEFDDDDGALSSTSSSLAGVPIPADGTYYLVVTCLREEAVVPNYDLHVRVQSGSPTAETAATGTLTGQTLPGSGWISGALSENEETDTYRIALNAGDTLFLSLDLDPERDGTGWDGQLSLNPVSNPTRVFTVNGSDAYRTSDADNDSLPGSEAFVLTVKDAGAYVIKVASVNGDTSGTYRLSASVLPAATGNISTTYAATISSAAIVDRQALTSTLVVPTSKRIGKLKVALNLTHANLPDLDVHLTAPDGNIIGLFRNVSDSDHSTLDAIFDDAAAYAIGFAQDDEDNPLPEVAGAIFKPGRNYRLDSFAGQQAQGTWALTIRDRADNDLEGTLDSWSLIVVDEDALPTGTATTRFSANFESNDGGFTHSGTNDDWAHGTPTAAPIANAYSGTQAWKTSLAGNHRANSNQDLVSPTIDLSAVPNSHPIELSWAMSYQLDDASKDGAYVEVEEVGGANTKRIVWRWLGSAMRDTNVGSTNETIEQSAGWGLHRARIDDFRGKTIRVRFHLASDGDGEFAGLAIDDVAIKSYAPLPDPEPDPEPTVATITLSGLNVPYTGAPRSVSASTSPGGLSVRITYNGSTTAPTAIGSYAVVATVTSAGYTGTKTGTLVIGPALPPTITQQPSGASIAPGGSTTLTVVATGIPPLTYQWLRNGRPIANATSASLTIANADSSSVGYYTVLVTGGGTSILSNDAIVELAFPTRVNGDGVEVLSDVQHPNGNVYDQILITGEATSTKANPEQVVRLSFVDLSDDIVQVEFYGAGTITVTLDNSSGPAAPVNYNQPDVSYMKGHATIEITGANETSHLSIFSVGRITAINQALFRDNVSYDGIADIALVTIASTDGKFGGVRTGNVSYFSHTGFTGIYAPGVDLMALYVHDVSASDDAVPVLLTGQVADVRITGGSLLQANDADVEIGGIARVDFVDGATSHGLTLTAQLNQARFTRDGVDVTADLIE